MTGPDKSNEEKALKVFTQAERFCEAGLVLNRHMSKTNEINAYMLPTMVLATFSLELYLKTLLQLECGGFPTKHDLEFLFKRLRPETQEKIRALYEDAESLNEIDRRRYAAENNITISLDNDLKDSKNAFVCMRYIFDEQITDRSFFACSYVLQCTRRYILELKPEWPSRFSMI